ncbi:hypothetical protein QQP08_003322, partial [Theobroma cacao]
AAKLEILPFLIMFYKLFNMTNCLYGWPPLRLRAFPFNDSLNFGLLSDAAPDLLSKRRGETSKLLYISK